MGVSRWDQSEIRCVLSDSHRQSDIIMPRFPLPNRVSPPLYPGKTATPNLSPRRTASALLPGLLGCGAAVATIYATPVDGAAGLGCGLEALSCDAALTSRFSKVGPVSLGVLGLFYFVFWTLNLRAFQRTGDGIYRWVISWVTALGALVSISLAVVLFLVLRAPCLYCLLSHGANLASVALLWPIFNWKLDFRFRSDHLRHFFSLAAISALAAHLKEKKIDPERYFEEALSKSIRNPTKDHAEVFECAWLPFPSRSCGLSRRSDSGSESIHDHPRGSAFLVLSPSTISLTLPPISKNLATLGG